MQKIDYNEIFIDNERYLIKNPNYGKDEYTKEIGTQYWKKLEVNGKAYKNRLNYEVVFDESNDQRLTFILFNPSTANQKQLDPTIDNCRKITKALNKKRKEQGKKEYGGILIYNTFTVRHPVIEEAIKEIKTNYDYEIQNNPVFNLCRAPKVNDIVLAWGNDVKKLENDYFIEIKKVLSKLDKSKYNLFAYRVNNKGKGHPTHPGPRCNRFISEFCKQPKLEELPVGYLSFQ